MKAKFHFIVPMFAVCVTQTFWCEPLLAADSEPGAKIHLLAHTSRTNYLAGEKITLEIVITNGSSKPLIFGQDRLNLDGECTYHVSGDDKQEVPETRLGKIVLSGSRGFSKIEAITLASGQTYTNAVVISRLFDLTLPQSYEVTVSRRFYVKLPADTTEIINSGPVRFTVSAF